MEISAYCSYMLTFLPKVQLLLLHCSNFHQHCEEILLGSSLFLLLLGNGLILIQGMSNDDLCLCKPKPILCFHLVRVNNFLILIMTCDWEEDVIIGGNNFFGKLTLITFHFICDPRPLTMSHFRHSTLHVCFIYNSQNHQQKPNQLQFEWYCCCYCLHVFISLQITPIIFMSFQFK
jgi:hypothetical protein